GDSRGMAAPFTSINEHYDYARKHKSQEPARGLVPRRDAPGRIRTSAAISAGMARRVKGGVKDAHSPAAHLPAALRALAAGDRGVAAARYDRRSVSADPERRCHRLWHRERRYGLHPATWRVDAAHHRRAYRLLVGGVLVPRWYVDEFRPRAAIGRLWTHPGVLW